MFYINVVILYMFLYIWKKKQPLIASLNEKYIF